MNKWIVYLHIFPNGKKYVGITSRKPYERWHNGEGYKRQYVYRAIKKYKWHNIEHKILYTNLSKKEAEQKEIELIKEYKSNISEFGYNVEAGGNCTNLMSEQTRHKLSLYHKTLTGDKNHFFGKHHTKETIKKIVDKTGIKLIQYDLNGNYIKQWNSQNEVFKELGIDRKSIRLCYRGITKQAGGFIWKIL